MNTGLIIDPYILPELHPRPRKTRNYKNTATGFYSSTIYSPQGERLDQINSI
jgi:hypothetical protein